MAFLSGLLIACGGLLLAVLPFLVRGFIEVLEFKYGEETSEGVSVPLIAIVVRPLLIQLATSSLWVAVKATAFKQITRLALLNGGLSFAALVLWYLAVVKGEGARLIPSIVEILAMLAVGIVVGWVAITMERRRSAPRTA